MAEALRSDPIALRTCILYNMSEGMEVFDGYKRFCKALGDDVMDYNEYEYWFMRFAQGKLDLEYDRSQDPPLASFEDLTPAILRDVMSHLSLAETAILSRVSHDLRDVTKTAPIRHQKAVVKIMRESLSLKIDGKTFVSKRGSFEEHTCHRDYDNNTKGFNILTEGIAAMEKFLHHPRLKFEKKFELHVGIFGQKDNNSDYNRKLKDMLIKFIRGIAKHVTSVTIEYRQFMLDYLVLFTPGKLEEINFKSCYYPHDCHPKIIAHTEQYKKIKRLVVNREVEEVPFEFLYRLEYFEIGGRPNGSKEKCRELENAIFRGEFPNFKKCLINSYDPDVYNIVSWGQTFGEFVESFDGETELYTTIHRPDSDDEDLQKGMALKMTVIYYDNDDWYHKWARPVVIERIN